MDALADFAFSPGPCTLVGGTFFTTCPAFSVAAGSAVLPAIAATPAVCIAPGLPADSGSILVPPGTPAIPPCLPGGCPPGGLPCITIPSVSMGLIPGPGGDDLDALCWWDDGDLVPELPGLGDWYLFSLAPGSPSLAALGLSPADILYPTLGLGGVGGVAPLVGAPAAALGLLPTDNLDALICHDMDADGDGVPDVPDNCPGLFNPGQANTDAALNAAGASITGDGLGDACDPDDDNDAWPDSSEGTIGTNPVDNCILGPGTGGDSWPADMAPIGAPDAAVSGADLSAVAAQIGFAVPPGSVRRNIAPIAAPDSAISGADLSAVAARIGFACA
ncbi:MAG: thrombospondin type 3 repeat-containing protein [Chloroflexi bacterium]|nr:thrombospondin type 3 repeat-containing protein [Chloroflexota bacterium]